MRESLVGMKFGRLTVTAKAGMKCRQTMYDCICDDGNLVTVRAGHLLSGAIKSCGCLSVETARRLSTTHGMCDTPTYYSWNNMVSRCYCDSHIEFPRYGAKGITVCERWRTFENFLADMGERPEGKTIDRYPNQDGNYEPGNCRWATPTEQCRNKRNNRMVTFKGKTQCLKQWTDDLGIGYFTTLSRLNRGWSPEAAFGVTI